MKRNKKLVIILLLLMILSAGGAVGTVLYANSQSPEMGQMGTPPDMNQSDQSGQTPPSMPEGENNTQSDSGQTPPSLPDNNSSQSDTGNTQPSQTDGDSSNTPPSLPDGDSSNTPPSMPNGNDSSVSGLSIIEIGILSGCILVFTTSGLLLIGTKAGKTSIKEMSHKLALTGGILVLTGALTFGSVYGVNHYVLSQPQMGNGQPGEMTQQESSNVEASGATAVTSDATLTETYTSSTSDESPIVVSDGATATITGATITKESGDSSNTENSEFYGVNSGILVQKNSTAVIKNTTISTNAKGSNAVFATGENAKITISDSTITTTGSGSARGLDATYGGTIEADNVTITTQGQSCATLATDRGEGTVTANNSTLETNGQGSPVIYSTGDISIDNTKGTANGSQMVVIEGKNSATVTNSTLTASGKGNRNDVDNCGIMIYQSMSGDASEGTGTFTAKNSTLSISSSSSYYKSAPMFFITNTDAKINLANTKLQYGSNTLLSIKGTDEWGNSGSNGGTVEFNASKQTLEGNIEVDKLSTLTLNLKNSTYKGTINSANSAKSLTVTLDSNSTLELTGDSYITTLTIDNNDTSKIKSNGYTIYYDASSNSWLNGKTVTLSDGGKLVPMS